MKTIVVLVAITVAILALIALATVPSDDQVAKSIVAGEQGKVWPTATRAVLSLVVPGDVVKIDGKLGIVTCKNGLCRNEQGEFYVIPKPGGSALVEGWYPASRMKYVGWIVYETPTPRP